MSYGPHRQNLTTVAWFTHSDVTGIQGFGAGIGVGRGAARAGGDAGGPGSGGGRGGHDDGDDDANRNDPRQTRTHTHTKSVFIPLGDKDRPVKLIRKPG